MPNPSQGMPVSKLTREEFDELEKEWQLTINSNYSDTERLFWFARVDDNGRQETVKLPGSDAGVAWARLAQHVKNPGLKEPELNRAARLHQARVIEAEIASLQQKQDDLLDPLMVGLDKLSDAELAALRDELPKGFHRTELQTMINQRKDNKRLSGTH